MTEEQRKEREKAKDDAAKVVRDSQFEYSKQILSLSAGVLALSVSFLKSVVDIESATMLSLLYTSWGLLIAAIFITLSAIKISIKAHQIFQKDLEIEIIGEQSPIIGETWRDKFLPKCSWFATIAFGLGILGLVLFSGVNIQKEKHMKDERTTSAIREIQLRELGRSSVQDHVEVQRLRPVTPPPPSETPVVPPPLPSDTSKTK